HELFHRDLTAGVAEKARPGPRRRVESRAIDSFLDLNEGDYVVHVSHGLALYRGMEMLPRAGADSPAPPLPRGGTGGSRAAPLEEHLVLEFRGGVRVYVPASRIELVQKYVGGSRAEPELSKYGGSAWGRRKKRVAEAVRDLAGEMLQLQALREAQPGFAYPAD